MPLPVGAFPVFYKKIKNWIKLYTTKSLGESKKCFAMNFK